jgi:pantoate--beta-alanine ligase
MKILRTVHEMQAEARQTRLSRKVVGLVPTMGFLHAGHASLIRTARGISDIVVVSIFVNPVQFGPGEDFASYPRDLDRDTQLCRSEGADMLFVPESQDMYGAGHGVFVEEEALSRVLCGASRPGHFRGVLTVVAKLFHIVQPDVAVFGQKDAQQARVIQRMVRDLNFPVGIVVVPTVREPDGLAMSSRNVRLSPDERVRATCLFKALRLAERMHRDGARQAAEIKEAMRTLIHDGGPLEIDYVELMDWETLSPVDRIDRPTLAAVAVRIGRTRLIDNAVIGE